MQWNHSARSEAFTKSLSDCPLLGKEKQIPTVSLLMELQIHRSEMWDTQISQVVPTWSKVYHLENPRTETKKQKWNSKLKAQKTNTIHSTTKLCRSAVRITTTSELYSLILRWITTPSRPAHTSLLVLTSGKSQWSNDANKKHFAACLYFRAASSAKPRNQEKLVYDSIQMRRNCKIRRVQQAPGTVASAFNTEMKWDSQAVPSVLWTTLTHTGILSEEI